MVFISIGGLWYNIDMAVVKKTKKMTLNQSNALASLAMENMALTDKEVEEFLRDTSSSASIRNSIKRLSKKYSANK